MKATDFWGKGMTDNCKKKMSFLRHMILINDPLESCCSHPGNIVSRRRIPKDPRKSDNQQNLPLEGEGQCFNHVHVKKTVLF